MFDADPSRPISPSGRSGSTCSTRHPFFQRAGFSTQEPSGINRLAQELSRGNNATLFDHTTDDPPPALSPPRAALLVIAEQAFAVGGGKSDTGNTTHAPLVSGAVVLVRGNNLLRPLWLNLTVFRTGIRSPAGGRRPGLGATPAQPHTQPSRPARIPRLPDLAEPDAPSCTPKRDRRAGRRSPRVLRPGPEVRNLRLVSSTP